MQPLERLKDRGDFDGSTRFAGGDVRGDGRRVKKRIDPVQRRLEGTGGHESADILVAAVGFNARRHGFHAERRQSGAAGGVQQGARRVGFTRAGVGAGDEKCLSHGSSMG